MRLHVVRCERRSLKGFEVFHVLAQTQTHYAWQMGPHALLRRQTLTGTADVIHVSLYGWCRTGIY